MIEIKVEQGTEDWFLARSGLPTASKFDKIITPAKLKPSTSATSYLYELMAECVMGRPLDDVYHSAWMERGTELEQEAVDYYEFTKQVDVNRAGFCVTDDKRIGCSPDGLVGEDGGLEIKCPSLSVHLEYLTEQQLPDKYRAQVQGSMYVTGRKWWDFLSYNPAFDSMLIRVERDEEFMTAFHKIMTEFLDRYDVVRAKLETRTGRKLIPGGGVL